MRASVIIASLNEGERLWKTVQSCLESTAGLECEVVVADDASTDRSTDELRRRFPQVPVLSRKRRHGVAPTRRLGARFASGGVLIFLDGHCKPEPGAIEQLVKDVERLDGRAIVSPRIAVLNEHTWQNHLEQGTGHGFHLDLETLDRRWLRLEEMRPHAGETDRRLYESPALVGCCAALSAELYRALGGFDPGMRMWGAEDIDLGLKAWLCGSSVLHDPAPVVGHRFRTEFDNFPVAVEHVLANELRLARKHFGDAVWLDWVERCRARQSEVDWPEVWALFERGHASLRREGAVLRARRIHDEFCTPIGSASGGRAGWPAGNRTTAGRMPCRLSCRLCSKSTRTNRAVARSSAMPASSKPSAATEPAGSRCS